MKENPNKELQALMEKGEVLLFSEQDLMKSEPDYAFRLDFCMKKVEQGDSNWYMGLTSCFLRQVWFSKTFSDGYSHSCLFDETGFEKTVCAHQAFSELVKERVLQLLVDKVKRKKYLIGMFTISGSSESTAGIFVYFSSLEGVEEFLGFKLSQYLEYLK